jgi:hypothetical protein
VGDGIRVQEITNGKSDYVLRIVRRESRSVVTS